MVLTGMEEKKKKMVLKIEFFFSLDWLWSHSRTIIKQIHLYGRRWALEWMQVEMEFVEKLWKSKSHTIHLRALAKTVEICTYMVRAGVTAVHFVLVHFLCSQSASSCVRTRKCTDCAHHNSSVLQACFLYVYVLCVCLCVCGWMNKTKGNLV